MTTILTVPNEVKERARKELADALLYVDIATSFSIETDDDAKTAGEQLVGITKILKGLDAYRLEQTRPIDQLKKDITAELSEPSTKLEEASRLLRAELTRWTVLQKKLADDRRRAEEDRLEQARRDTAAELAREQAKLASLKTDAARERAMDRVGEVEERANELAVTGATKIKAEAVKGFSLRDNWQPEYDDINALIKAAAANPKLSRYLTFETKAIGAVVKAMKDATDIPGVRAVNNQTSAVR